MRRLDSNNRGVSNVIVVVLSLILLVVIVTNVIIWSYQMNQFDWERIHEDLHIAGVVLVNSSAWATVQNEFTANVGTRASGAYVDTQTVDDRYESFTGGLNLTDSFEIDLTAYPISRIKTIEAQMRYRASDLGDRLYLKAWNWTASTYDDGGFNSTSGEASTGSWDYYGVNLTDQWRSYVNSNGTICVEIVDELAGTNQTTFDLDFLGLRLVIEGALFSFENRGSTTSHLVSLWVDNATFHQRYDVNLFINSGERRSYSRFDVTLGGMPLIIRLVSDKGTVSVFRLS